MQLNLIFADRPEVSKKPSIIPWDQLDPEARAEALAILSRLIARMLAARKPVETRND
jgi:hypothetical protein